MGSAYGQSAILGPGHDGGRFRGNPSTGGWRKCASSGQHGRHGRRQALSPTTRAALVGLRRLQFSAQSWHGRGVGVQPATRWPHADACWPLVSAQLLPHSAALPPQSQDTCPLPARAPWATVHPPPRGGLRPTPSQCSPSSSLTGVLGGVCGSGGLFSFSSLVWSKFSADAQTAGRACEEL